MDEFGKPGPRDHGHCPIWATLIVDIDDADRSRYGGPRFRLLK